MKTDALRTGIEDGVFTITLSRAREYNTITPQLRDDLAAAIDAAEASPDARVILLRAEGPAFCAGYALDWGTAVEVVAEDAARDGQRRVWDSYWRSRSAPCGEWRCR